MRLLPLFLVACSAAFGAWDATNDDIYINRTTNSGGDETGCFFIAVDTDDTLGTVRIAIDQDTTTSNGNKGLEFTGVGGHFNYDLCVELQASTTYYITIETSGNGNFTCSGTDTDGTLELLAAGYDLTGGFACAGSGQPIRYITGGTVPSAPAAPDLPDIPDHFEEQIFDATFTTTWDVSATAGIVAESDFDTAVQAATTAFAANCNNWYKVTLPQGSVLPFQCDSGDETNVRLYSWPSNSCDEADTGGIVVTTAGDAKLFPPEGTHSDPTFAPIYATLRRKGLCEWDGFMIRAGGNTSRVFFKNLNIINAPAGSIDAQMTFDQMDSTTTLSVPATVPSTDDEYGDGSDWAIVCDVPNEDTAGLTGHHTCTDCDAGDDPITIGTTFDNSTACASGGLLVARPTGWGITSVSAAGRVVTAITHDGLTFPQLDATLTDLTDGAHVVLDSAMPSPGGSDWIANGDTVIVEGTGLGLDDYLCVVENKTSSTEFDLTGPDSDTTRCDAGGTSATGTIRIMEPLCIDFTSLDAANACWYYNVVDRNTLDLLEVTGAAPSFGGTGSGGYGSINPEISSRGMYTFASGITNREIGFIHNNINAGSFPLRGFGLNEGVCCAATHLDGRQWIGNYMEGAFDWSILDPMDGDSLLRRGTSNQGNSVKTTYNISGVTSNLRIEREKAHIGGFGIAGGSATYQGATNLAINRNTLYYPEEYAPGHPANTGRRQRARHPIEFKTYHKLQVWGNRIKNNQGFLGDAGNPSPWLALKEGSGQSTGFADSVSFGHVSIMGNVAPNTSEFLLFTTENSTNYDWEKGPFEIGYNFLAVNYRPNSVEDRNGGCLVRREAPVGSFNFHHNTVVHTSAADCEAFLFRWHQGHASLVSATNNIIQVNGESDASEWFAGSEGTADDYSPANPATKNNKDLWDYTNIVVGSNGSLARGSVGGFDDNVLIPGVENARLNVTGLLAAMASTDDADRMTAAEVTAITNTISLHTTTAQDIVSAASTNAAWEAVLAANSWTDIESGYAGYGADDASLRRYRGVVGSVPVASEVNSTTIRYTMDQPLDLDGNEFACSIDLSTDPDFDTAGNITRKTFTAASGDQTLDFTVSASTSYYMRTHCPVNRYFGEVTVP